jgi:hypothetical protein
MMAPAERAEKVNSGINWEMVLIISVGGVACRSIVMARYVVTFGEKIIFDKFRFPIRNSGQHRAIARGINIPETIVNWSQVVCSEANIEWLLSRQ